MQQFVLTLNENALHFLIVGCSLALALLQREPSQRLVAGLKEIGERDGLKQIVKGIETITVEGILVEGRGEDDAGLLGQHLRELHTVYFGHLDIEVEEVDGVLADALHGVNGI